MNKTKPSKVIKVVEPGKASRQGDVLIIPVDSVPAGLTRVDRCTLALGEKTGHHHTIDENAIGYGTSESGLANYFEVTSPEGAFLNHDEHHTLKIPQGTYRKVIQSEYRKKVFQRVRD